MAFTLYFANFTWRNEHKKAALHKKYPQVNKITFVDNDHDIRDSIKALTILMNKLPHRKDHDNVAYEIKKYRGQHNDFCFNWIDLYGINLSHSAINLTDYIIPQNKQSDWQSYVTNNLYPFHSFNKSEAERFILLIKYLDRNSMNAAELVGQDMISLTYNDSLRTKESTGFRKIQIDTAGYYLNEYQTIHDARNGFFLTEQLNND